jgi:RNA polymerase sigma factor (sigma-70 family)
VDDVETLVLRAADANLPAAERLAAFGEIVRRFQDMAYGCAYALLGDFHLAEDAAQEAFVTVYRELPELRAQKAFAGWLRRIVVTQCHRMTRRKEVPTTDLGAAELHSVELGPSEAMEAQEMGRKVLAALRGLPEHQRMVTTLFYINGYSQKDIAGFLDVPVTTVKKRLADARERLKRRMMNMVGETLKSYPLPGNFAGIVVRKAASQRDLAEAAKLIAYEARVHPEAFASTESAERAGIYIVGEDGKVDAAGVFDTFEMGIGSTILTCARPSEMGAEAVGVPDPAFVKGFQACFKLAAEHNIHLAAVHGSQYDHAFCGFVPCFYYPVATLPCERVKSLVTRAKIAKATQTQAEEARRAWLLDPFAPKMSAYLGGGAPHVVTQDDRVVGYIRVNPEFRPKDKYGMPFGHITDITVKTWDAALAVLRLAGKLVSEAGESTICLMQSHLTLITQAMLALGGTYVLRGSCDVVGLDAEMVAIIDLPGLTEDLEAEFQSRFRSGTAHDAEAAFSIEINEQAVGFVAAGRRLRNVREKQPVHRPLPHWIVTRLYVGYYSGEDVLAMRPIPWGRYDVRPAEDQAAGDTPIELPEPEAALFKVLFPKLWPVSWPDPDVWPWVLGKPYPKYQGEEHKTADIKAQIDALRFHWIGW